jgi:hypothetical protein
MIKLRHRSGITLKREGEDVIELYARPENSGMHPFLVGFSRIKLTADEETEISIPFDRKWLTLVDEEGQRHSAGCKWTLFVSKDSSDRHIAISVEA